jgi:hypothetical protein
MVALNLTQEQYDSLVDLALREREAIRESIEWCDAEGAASEIESYDELAEVFGLETWKESNNG